MRVTLRDLYATPDRIVQAGATVDLPDKLAASLVKCGTATKAEPDEPATPAEEDDGQFDPSDHNVGPVNAYLEEAWEAGDGDEIDRVLAAEFDGEDRTTVVDPRDTDDES